MYDKSSSQVYGLWALASCPALGLPQEDGNRRPKSQPQTPNYRRPIWSDLFTLRSAQGPASSHPHPHPLGTVSSSSSRRPGNEFPPFPFEKAGDQESCRNLLPFYSYKSISSDPNSPSRFHHSSKLESLDLISSRPSHTCRRAARSSLPARSGPAGPDAPGPCRSLLQALSITSPTSETPVLSAATWDRLWKGSSCNRSWSKAGLGKLLGGVTRRVGAKMSQLLNSRS